MVFIFNNGKDKNQGNFKMALLSVKKLHYGTASYLKYFFNNVNNYK